MRAWLMVNHFHLGVTDRMGQYVNVHRIILSLLGVPWNNDESVLCGPAPDCVHITFLLPDRHAFIKIIQSEAGAPRVRPHHIQFGVVQCADQRPNRIHLHLWVGVRGKQGPTLLNGTVICNQSFPT